MNAGTKARRHVGTKEWLALAICAIFAQGCGAGLLSGVKTVDSTRAIEAIEKTEAVQSGPIVIPGDITGDPVFSGKVIALHNVPGKDVSFTTHFPDGTPNIQLTTSLSGVVEKLLGGIAGIDTGKFGNEQAWADRIDRRMDRWEGYMQQYTPLIQDALQARIDRYQQNTTLRQAAASQPSLKSTVIDLLRDPEAVKALKDALKN